MASLGACQEPLPAWGKNGEPFILFWWTRNTWRFDDVLQQRRIANPDAIPGGPDTVVIQHVGSLGVRDGADRARSA